jgi:O-antigen/teichoic acid export membrane protein
MLKKLPSSMRSIYQLLSSSILMKVIGILVLSLYARLLSKEELAFIPFYYMLVGITVVPLSFGIYPTMVKKLPHLFQNDMAKGIGLLWSSAIILGSGGGIVALVIFLFSDNITQYLFQGVSQSQLVEIMAIGCFFFVIERIADRVLWATERFGKTAKIQVITSFFRPTISLILFYFFDLQGIIIGLVLAQILTTGMSLYYIRDFIFINAPKLYPIKLLIKQSLPFYAESYLMYFRKEGDSWFVSIMLGSSGLAIYYIAKTIYGALFTIYSTVDRVVVSSYSKKFNQPNFNQIIQRTFDNLVQTIIPIIFILISILPTVVWLIGGNDFQSAVYPAAILLIALLLNIMRIPMNRAIFVATKSKYRLYMTVVESIILFCALSILTPFYGILGIALSRVFAQVAGAFYCHIIAIQKLNARLVYRAILIVTGISLFIMVVIYKTNNQLVTNLTDGFIQIIVSITIWLFMYSSLSYFFNKDIFLKLKKLIN